MPGWVIWMLVAAALAGGEMLTLGLFLGPLSLAAVLAALVALGGGSVELQAAAFVAGSVAALAIVRPIARRHMRTPAHIRTGAAALIGQRAIVLEKVRSESNPNYGFNAEAGRYEDLVQSGVIDPAKVCRSAIQNAASIASLMLTTEAMVAEIPEKKPAPAPAGHGPDMDY